MLRLKHVFLAACCFLVVAQCRVCFAENEGQDDLDKATQLKVTAQSLDDLNEVVDRLETALEKGLDDENTKFAEQLLVASLLQRGNLFTMAGFNLPLNDAQQRLRALQFRQFALNDLQRAVQLDPTLWEAHLQIGKLQALADANAARRALTQVVDAEEATPEQRAEALALRSTVQRDDDRKMADINRAVELVPKLPDYLRLRAQHFFRTQKFDEALADIDKALELEEDHAQSHELRGMILMGMKRNEEAVKSFDRASELAPENVATLLVRAGAHFEMKENDRALEDIDKAIELQPQLVQPYLMRAEILAATERMDEAITELEKLLETAPNQPQILQQLSTFYLIDGNADKAIDTFNKVLQQDPDNFRALRFRADAYLNTGQHEEAIADFERIINRDEVDDGVLNNFAWVLATSPDDELRDGKRAVELATKAAERTNYETPHILSTLAAAYAETGDFENAKKWSAKSIELAQKAIESADSDAERERLQKEQEQLKKELANFEEGKPVRERQTGEQAEDEDRSA
jgi:tetratricopeptide (TPR) repeat protein